MKTWIGMADEALKHLKEIRQELRTIRELLEAGAVTPQRVQLGEAFGPRETTR